MTVLIFATVACSVVFVGVIIELRAWVQSLDHRAHLRKQDE